MRKILIFLTAIMAIMQEASFGQDKLIAQTSSHLMDVWLESRLPFVPVFAVTDETSAEKEANLETLGRHINETGRYLGKTYTAYSIVPGTWRWMSKEIEKEEGSGAIGALLVGIVLLPADLAISRLYGSFTGSYYFGRAGDHLVEASTVIPSQQAVLMERAGNNLKSCRTVGLVSSSLFYAGFSVAVVKYYKVLFGEEKSASLSIPLISMTAGYGLRLLSVHYAGSAGKRLEEISASFPEATQRNIMEAGKSLRSYESRTYWGYGLQALGIAIAVVGIAKDNDTVGAIGTLTTLGGWIVSSPLAIGGIKSASERLFEAGNLMLQQR